MSFLLLDFYNILFNFFVRIECTIHIAYRICINQLFMLWVRLLPVNSKLLKFLGVKT